MACIRILRIFTKLKVTEDWKKKKIEQDIQELWGNDKRCNMHVIRILEGKERQKGTEEVLEVIMMKNFPGINRHWTTDSESSEHTKQDKYQKCRKSIWIKSNIMIKTLTQLEIQENLLHLIKNIYKESLQLTLCYWWETRHSLIKYGTRQRYPLSNHC